MLIPYTSWALKRCFFTKKIEIFGIEIFIESKICWRAPKLLDRLKCESKVKTAEK
jgi:hypothetical protein